MSAAVYKNTKSIITGGIQGLGFAIPESLIVKWCQHIILEARDSEKGQYAAKALTNQGASVHFHKTDLSDTQSVISMVDFAENKMSGAKLFGLFFIYMICIHFLQHKL